jgi:MSHA biogenesis protein MshP
MNKKADRKQRGFALIGAIFVLVVLAALGAFAVRINMTQQHGADLDLQQLRAEAALNTGIEFAATRLLASAATDNCGDLAAPLTDISGGYQVTFPGACTRVQHVINGVQVTVYTINVTSTRGVYGTPEFVQRQLIGVRLVG